MGKISKERSLEKELSSVPTELIWQDLSISSVIADKRNQKSFKK